LNELNDEPFIFVASSAALQTLAGRHLHLVMQDVIGAARQPSMITAPICVARSTAVPRAGYACAPADAGGVAAG